jgi:biopolymer transport protein ExbB/TolQ
MENFINKTAAFFQHGGIMMFFNLIISVIVIALIVDRIIGLVMRNKLDRPQFMNHILKMVSSGRIQEAIKMCRTEEARDSALAKVVLAGLSRADKGGAAVQAGIEAAILDVAPEVKKRVPILWALANIATLIGLIGTISGLIGAFAALSGSNIPADKRQEFLGNAISEAMNNTAFGLSIAVACMISHVLLNGRAKSILEDIERYSLQLENALVFRESQAQAS